MTARPPRASSKDAKPAVKRAKTRGGTMSERDRPDLRSSSAVPTDRYERIGDDDVLEVEDAPDAAAGDAPGAESAAEAATAPAAGPRGGVRFREATASRRGPRLRMLVLETAPHLAAAQGAIAAAGHVVVIGAAGRDGVDKLRFAVGEVDAMLVGMPGGEALIELALALPAPRPVVIAAWTASALEATRRSAEIRADLATVRPHDVERLAPILLAARRLVEHRRGLGGAAGAASSTAVASRAAPPVAASGAPPASSSAASPEPVALPPVPDAAPGGPEPSAAPAVAGVADVEVDVDVDIDVDLEGMTAGESEPIGDGVVVGIEDDLDLDGDGDGVGLLDAERFALAAQGALERARRDAQPLVVALFMVDVAPPPPPPGLRGILRARASNALVHALRPVDLATELDQDRFLVVMPDTDRAAGAEHARRLISAVAAGPPVTAAGRTFPPKVIGAVAGAEAGGELDLPRLVRDATQLLEQAQVTGASLAVES